MAASAYGLLRYWHQGESGATKLWLRDGATHESQHVRREAVIAASHIGTADALEAILPVLDQPAGTHLSYAISTSLASENLSRHWEGTASEDADQQRPGAARQGGSDKTDHRKCRRCGI